HRGARHPHGDSGVAVTDGKRRQDDHRQVAKRILPERDVVDRGIQGAPNIACEISRTARMATIPSQNDGVAMPAMAIVRTTWSIQLFCFNAEMVPSGTEMAMATTVAITAISSEIGKRAAISSATGLPDHIEMPKSRRKKPHTKSRNCRIG